jgi:hypothetical protein
MQLEDVIRKLLKFIDTRLQALSLTVTSGSIDSMENYKYIIGQINGLEATRQELSNLLENKEQNGKATVIDINTKQWVMFARYAGSRIKIEGGEMRLLNDDEVLATIDSPEDILHEF